MSTRALHSLACGAFVAGSAAAYLVAAAPVGRRGLLYIGLHGGLSVAMLLTWWTATRLPNAARKRAFAVTLTAGVIARLVLVPVPNFTSTDVLRYLWDGRVALLGLDPYAFAPDAIGSLLEPWPPPAVHRELPTLYPPGAIGLFALAALFGPYGGWWAWKILVAAASVATLFLMAFVLRAVAPERLAIVALSPLLLLEGGVGTHVDVVATLAVATAIALRQRGRTALWNAALAVGACLKPLVVLPLLPAAFGSHSAARGAAAAGVVIASVGVAARLAGWSLVGSLPVFASQWRFGSPAFAVATTLGDAFAWAVAFGITAAAFSIAARAMRNGCWVTASLCALTAPLIAGPVVFPWYLAPLVPLLALSPSAMLLGWTTTIVSTYEVIDLADAAGRWEPATWPLAVIALGWLAGALVDSCSRRASAMPDARWSRHALHDRGERIEHSQRIVAADCGHS